MASRSRHSASCRRAIEMVSARQRHHGNDPSPGVADRRERQCPPPRSKGLSKTGTVSLWPPVPNLRAILGLAHGPAQGAERAHQTARHRVRHDACASTAAVRHCPAGRAACPGAADLEPGGRRQRIFSAHGVGPADAPARAARHRARVGDARSIRDGVRRRRCQHPACACRGRANARAAQHFAIRRAGDARSIPDDAPQIQRPACACRDRADAHRSRCGRGAGHGCARPVPDGCRGLPTIHQHCGAAALPRPRHDRWPAEAETTVPQAVGDAQQKRMIDIDRDLRGWSFDVAQERA